MAGDYMPSRSTYFSSLVSTAEGFQKEELYQNAEGHGRTLSCYAA